MSQELIRNLNKILISGTKEDLDKLLEGLSENEQKELLINMLASTSYVMEDPKLLHVKTRPLLYNLISNAEKRGKEENKDVYITYLDQRKLGKISNTYGVEVGDRAIHLLVDALHYGLEGIKKSNYNIVRMGGDEFCVITVGESKEVVDEYMKEAKTIANNMTLMHHSNAIKEKIDFAYGTTKLDYSGGKTLREIIDDAKEEEYYQAKLTEAEGIAEAKKAVLIDPDKEREKINAIESYIKTVTDVEKHKEDYSYEIIEKNTTDVDKKIIPKKSIDSGLVMKLSSIAESEGLKRKVLVYDLFKYDIDFLKENFVAFGENFIREGKENFVKNSSLDILFNSTEITDTTKFKYFEVDNLKLVNGARTHQEGDNYISDFMNIVDESINEAGDKSKESYVIRMSGNEFVVMYDERNEKAIDSIETKAHQYQNPNINISMDIYPEDIKFDEGEEINANNLFKHKRAANDIVKVRKADKNRNIQKVIFSDDGYEIFYQRETFTMDEVETLVNQNIDECRVDEITLDYVDELISKYNKDVFDIIDNEIAVDLDDNSREALNNYAAISILKEEMEEQIELKRLELLDEDALKEIEDILSDDEFKELDLNEEIVEETEDDDNQEI